MISVLRLSWPLLLGMFLLQIGNGLQGSLMGVRGVFLSATTKPLRICCRTPRGAVMMSCLMLPSSARKPMQRGGCVLWALLGLRILCLN